MIVFFFLIWVHYHSDKYHKLQKICDGLPFLTSFSFVRILFSKMLSMYGYLSFNSGGQNFISSPGIYIEHF